MIVKYVVKLICFEIVMSINTKVHFFFICAPENCFVFSRFRKFGFRFLLAQKSWISVFIGSENVDVRFYLCDNELIPCLIDSTQNIFQRLSIPKMWISFCIDSILFFVVFFPRLRKVSFHLYWFRQSST